MNYIFLQSEKKAKLAAFNIGGFFFEIKKYKVHMYLFFSCKST